MPLVKAFVSRTLTRLVTSPRLRSVARAVRAARRTLLRQPAQVHYFHQVDDPYSHLTALHLAALESRYRIQLHIHLVPPPPQAAAPDATRLRTWSARDATRLAAHLGLEVPDFSPHPDATRILATQCAAAAHQPITPHQLAELSTAFWRGADTKPVRPELSPPVRPELVEGQSANQVAGLAESGFDRLSPNGENTPPAHSPKPVSSEPTHPVHPEPPPSVRPEPVEGHPTQSIRTEPHPPVRPELVEGQSANQVAGLAESGFDRLSPNGENTPPAHSLKPVSSEPTHPVHPEPHPPVRPELVEGQSANQVAGLAESGFDRLSPNGENTPSAHSLKPVSSEPTHPVHPEPPPSVRPEPVEGQSANQVAGLAESGFDRLSPNGENTPPAHSPKPVRPELSPPVRPEPVEGYSANELANAEQALEQGRALRQRLGHYLGATFWFEGEWYWGMDRLHYLEQRLVDQGLAVPPTAKPLVAPPALRMPPQAHKGTGPVVIHFYLSLRSPYTWLAAAQVRRLAQHYGATLQLRFVLPMVMRGLPVPLEKRLYITRDTKREAERLGLPFGCIVDPVGTPTERGLAVLHRAVSLGRGEAFAESFLQGVFAEGIDAGSDSGLLRLARRAGLSQADVQAALQDESWRSVAEANRQDMLERQLWGVPSFRVNDMPALWGQDRLWMLEQDLQQALNLNN